MTQFDRSGVSGEMDFSLGSAHPVPQAASRPRAVPSGASAIAPETPLGCHKPGETLLVIVTPEVIGMIGRMPRNAKVVSTRFNALNRGMLAKIAPNRVIFPLLAKSFDAADVVRRLHHLDYTGEATVLCPDLPKPAMIQTELQAIAPSLSVVLVNATATLRQQPPHQR